MPPSISLSLFLIRGPPATEENRSDPEKGTRYERERSWNETHSCKRDREEGKGDSEGPILRTIGGVQVSVVRPTVGTSVSAAI